MDSIGCPDLGQTLTADEVSLDGSCFVFSLTRRVGRN